MGITLKQVCGMHPVERFKLWPRRFQDVGTPYVQTLRTQLLLARLLALFQNVYKPKEEVHQFSYLDVAPWLKDKVVSESESTEQPEGAAIHQQMLDRFRNG